MIINAYEFEYRAKDLYSYYTSKQHLNRNEQQCKALSKDIVVTALNIRLNKGLFNFDPISKVKLRGSYPRKLVVKVFKKLDLTTTHYTHEYGRRMLPILSNC